MTAVGSEPLLERAAEIAAAQELLVGARGGRGGLLLLEAPAGLGKSTLAEHIVVAAEAFRVLRASGHELERGLGWGVARSLFESWLWSLPGSERDELLAGPAAPSRVLFESAEAFEGRPAADVSFGILHGLYWLAVRVAEREPLLLVVDDAHWVDEPSLRFVLYLQGRVREQRIALLVAARTGEPGEGGLLQELVAQPGTTVRELEQLGVGAVSELVRRRVEAADERFCRRCFELTRGNPLQVRELVAAIAQNGADLDVSATRAARSLSRSVLRRLGVLSPDAQALARAVAVFESDVPLHQAAALAGIEAGAALTAAEELARADILGPDDPLAFAHPLLRAAVYGALGRRERATTHRRAARLLADHGAPSEQIGTHLLEAPPAGDEEAVYGLQSAARSAMAHGVPESAIAYLERALQEPPADRSGVLAELGRAELVAGRRDAVAHLEAAIELADDPRRRAGLRLELGRTLHDFGRPADACAVVEAGLDEMRAAGEDPELTAELEAGYLTSAVMLADRAADAHGRVDAILARADRSPTAAERTLLSKAMIMRVYTDGPRDEVAALARMLFADGRLIEEDGLGSQAWAHAIITLSFCDEYEAAEEALRHTVDAVRRQGWATWLAAAAQLRARQRIWTGPIPDAVEDARTAVEIFSSGMQLYLPAALCVFVRSLLEHDEPDEAAAAAGRFKGGEPPVGPFAAWRDEAVGRLAAQHGDHERALEAFLACGERAKAVLITNPALFHWRSEAGLAALRLDRRDLAERLIAEELALAERFGAPRAIGVARRAAGLLERGEAAVELLRSSVDVLAGCGARVEHAHALVELGGAVRRAGRPTEARTMLREAIGLADSVGARAVARRGRDELTLAGGRAPARRDTAGELTPSERRVAELAAAGRTNREIANELFVTIKAVEWHLGNVYRKLDVRGRAQLPRAL